ncbi:unnamed protein product [Arabidopsis lyrata]|uniref:Predicted protein n=1 Tax=Arabidopsis lyrata subsp. lyrata TaxID=81972 RepID=D7MHV6_ARALL|nr:predicted protein [Arabidopsis lyrata subsp. lyrata]CAH8277128.1 unnamed protein product [Arabidopsis lyrata]
MPSFPASQLSHISPNVFISLGAGDVSCSPEAARRFIYRQTVSERSCKSGGSAIGLDPLRGLRGKGREKDLSVPLSFLLRLMMKSSPNAVRGDIKRLNVFEMGETEEQKWGKPSKEEN